MNYFLQFLFISFIFGSCKQESKSYKSFQENRIDSVCSSLNDSTWSITEFKNDTFQIDIINHNLRNFSIAIRLNEENKTYDLNKMKIAWKTPELTWFNKDFACFSTWTSGQFERCLYISLSDLNHYVYIDKSIEFSDSATNTILYVDRVLDAKEIQFVAKNIKTGNSKNINLPISRLQEYPYYDSLKMTKSQLTFWSNKKVLKFDLSSIKI